jgi:hypothetical protein
MPGFFYPEARPENWVNRAGLALKLGRGWPHYRSDYLKAEFFLEAGLLFQKL